jgi:hypothetical protein
MSDDYAPGKPGLDPTWSSSDKDMVTTGLAAGRIWTTLGHGILNEVYWPSTGRPQTRDLGFIVGDGSGTWTELKRANHYLFPCQSPTCRFRASYTNPTAIGSSWNYCRIRFAMRFSSNTPSRERACASMCCWRLISTAAVPIRQWRARISRP